MKKILNILLSLILVLSCFTNISFAEDEYYTPEATWEYSANSEWSANKIAKAFDGNIKSFWHSNYVAEGTTITSQDNPPFEITVKFPEAISISGFAYTPRPEGSDAGCVLGYKFLVAENDGDTPVLIAEGKMANSRDVKKVKLKGNVKAKKVVFIITEAVRNYGTMAEMAFIKPDASLKDVKASDIKIGESTLASSDDMIKTAEGWIITANSEWKDNKIAKAVDGNVNSFWHSNYVAEGTTITSQDKPPFEITVTFPEAISISGFAYTPRPAGMSDAGCALGYKLLVAENDGDTPVLVAEGKMANSRDVKTVKLTGNVKVKKAVFIITEAVRDYGTMAEFNFLKANSSLKDVKASEIVATGNSSAASSSIKKNWKITASSEFKGNEITKAFDGNVKTFWHSNYKAEGSNIVSQDKPPYQITIVMPEGETISGFTYTPRPAGMSESGRAVSYKFYIAGNETDEPVLVMEGDFANDPEPKTINLACNVNVKKVVFEISSGIRGYGTMSEFDFVYKRSDYDTIEASEFLSYREENLYYPMPKDGMTAHSDSVWESNTTAKILDGNDATFWHENPGDKAPIILDIDLGAEYEILGFSYFPRKEAENKGQWKRYNVYASLDGNDYELVLEDARMDIAYKEVIELFMSPVKCRYITFEVLEFNYHCACAELEFFESAEQKNAREKASYGKYVMQIDNPVMKVTKGGEAEKEVVLDVAPYLDNGTTMIPLRGLLTEMGAEIAWDGDTQSIMVNHPKAKVELQIMNPRVFVTTGGYGRVRYTLKGSAPKIKNSRTFIPLRFVSENLGYTVIWDGETKTITVETAKVTESFDANN